MVEYNLTRSTLQRFTLPQLKSLSIAFAARLPPRFALRGTKAVQVSQLANALWDTPAPAAAATVPAQRQTQPATIANVFAHTVPAAARSAIRAAKRCYPHVAHQLTLSLSAPTQPSALSQAERDLIRAALHPSYESISYLALNRVSTLRVANSSHYQLRFQLDSGTYNQLGRGTTLIIRVFRDLTGAHIQF